MKKCKWRVCKVEWNQMGAVDAAVIAVNGAGSPYSKDGSRHYRVVEKNHRALSIKRESDGLDEMVQVDDMYAIETAWAAIRETKLVEGKTDR